MKIIYIRNNAGNNARINDINKRKLPYQNLSCQDLESNNGPSACRADVRFTNITIGVQCRKCGNRVMVSTSLPDK